MSEDKIVYGSNDTRVGMQRALASITTGTNNTRFESLDAKLERLERIELLAREVLRTQTLPEADRRFAMESLRAEMGK